MKRKIPEALLNQEIRRRSNKLNNALMKKFPFFNRKIATNQQHVSGLWIESCLISKTT